MKPLNIALLGFGKMGKAIAAEAEAQGHQVVLKVESTTKSTLTPENLAKADVAIDFSQPSAVIDHIYLCFDTGVPIVVGTTGWYDQLPIIEADASCRKAALFYAPNFSIGVNLFMEMVEFAAEIMQHYPLFEVRVHETHHTGKKDSPSGTAMAIAERLSLHMKRKEKWAIESERVGTVVGDHRVIFSSEEDSIELTHRALNRNGFVKGALEAARFMVGKNGIFSMQDLITQP